MSNEFIDHAKYDRPEQYHPVSVHVRTLESRFDFLDSVLDKEESDIRAHYMRAEILALNFAIHVIKAQYALHE